MGGVGPTTGSVLCIIKNPEGEPWDLGQLRLVCVITVPSVVTVDLTGALWVGLCYGSRVT